MRISVKQFRADNGLESQDEFLDFLKKITWDGVAPALCSEGCEVEPDGMCPHKCPSILLALGYI